MSSATLQNSAVSIRNVFKSYGTTNILKDVSIEVEDGEFLTILGPSGCGKTTTLRVLAGFETVDRGDVFLKGQSVRSLPPWERQVGVVFQSYALFPFLTVHDNVAFGLRMRRAGREAVRAKVSEVLGLVGLSEFGTRYPSQLSGGQRQRVAIARALAIEPQLLLLDEPLSNLDAKLRREMRFELKRIQRESGVTTIFVTHDQEEAFSLSDQIVIMNGGEVRQAGAPHDIWSRPRSAFVAEFIGVENLLPASVKSPASGQSLVSVGDELTVAVPDGGGSDGPRVLGFRADKVTLAQAPQPGALSIPVTLEATEYRGGKTICRFRSSQTTSMVFAIVENVATAATASFAIAQPHDLMVLADDRG